LCVDKNQSKIENICADEAESKSSKLSSVLRKSLVRDNKINQHGTQRNIKHHEKQNTQYQGTSIGKDFNHQITHDEYIVISFDRFLSTQLINTIINTVNQHSYQQS
jgi:hypothetical protein